MSSSRLGLEISSRTPLYGLLCYGHWLCEKRGPPLFVFMEMVSMLWEERNKCHFEGKKLNTPLRLILQNVGFSGRALLEELQSEKKVNRFRKGLKELAKATNQLSNNPMVDDEPHLTI